MEGDLGETLTGGYGNNAGIIPRIIYNLFDDTGLRTKKHHIMVSMLELYNEDLRDLLCASDEQKPLNIFEEKDGTGIKVQNIQEQLISSASQGLEIMKAGVKKRMTASTKCNKKSRYDDDAIKNGIHSGLLTFTLVDRIAYLLLRYTCKKRHRKD